MAQIFISHSANDIEGVGFFSKVFAGTNVKAIFEEFEKLETKKITNRKIQLDINNSNAIFILLDASIEERKHTRDWIVWECGFGSQHNRDIWVFEKQKDAGKISIITPSLKHYLRYTDSDKWFQYIKAITRSYDDSHVLPTTLVTSGIGAALTNKADKTTGLILGAISGYALSQQRSQPLGLAIRCHNCDSIYNIHIPKKPFRCPVCNKQLRLKF